MLQSTAGIDSQYLTVEFAALTKSIRVSLIFYGLLLCSWDKTDYKLIDYID